MSAELQSPTVLAYHARLDRGNLVRRMPVDIATQIASARGAKGALEAGATMEEFMEVLKLCVVRGAQACNLGVPILAVSKPVARR